MPNAYSWCCWRACLTFKLATHLSQVIMTVGWLQSWTKCIRTDGSSLARVEAISAERTSIWDDTCNTPIQRDTSSDDPRRYCNENSWTWILHVWIHIVSGDSSFLCLSHPLDALIVLIDQIWTCRMVKCFFGDIGHNLKNLWGMFSLFIKFSQFVCAGAFMTLLSVCFICSMMDPCHALILRAILRVLYWNSEYPNVQLQKTSNSVSFSIPNTCLSLFIYLWYKWFRTAVEAIDSSSRKSRTMSAIFNTLEVF